MPLPRKQKIFPSVDTHDVWQRRDINCGTRSARYTNGAPALFFNAGNLTATLPPANRGSRVRKLRSVRFDMSNTDKFAFLDLPEIRYWFMWQRRVLIVGAASRLVEGGICSLNMAARLLGVPPSSLCVLLQRFRSGGDTALRPKTKTPLSAMGCRLSVYLRV